MGQVDGVDMADDYGDHCDPPDGLDAHDADIDRPVGGAEEVPAQSEGIGGLGQDELAGQQQVRQVVGQVIGERNGHQGPPAAAQVEASPPARTTTAAVRRLNRA
jgi:hypothetical protein